MEYGDSKDAFDHEVNDTIFDTQEAGDIRTSFFILEECDREHNIHRYHERLIANYLYTPPAQIYAEEFDCYFSYTAEDRRKGSSEEVLCDGGHYMRLGTYLAYRACSNTMNFDSQSWQQHLGLSLSAIFEKLRQHNQDDSDYLRAIVSTGFHYYHYGTFSPEQAKYPHREGPSQSCYTELIDHVAADLRASLVITEDIQSGFGLIMFARDEVLKQKPSQ